MSTKRLLIGGVGCLVVLLFGAAWSLGYFSDPPEEVSIEAAAAEAAAATAGTATTAPSTSDESASGGIDGTWTVDSSQDTTFVGYRINEVLTTIGDFEVVGRTSDVTGSLEIDDNVVTSVSLTAQMDTLSTDNAQRDRAMQNQALETSQFPEATFELGSPIGLESIPADGETISVAAPGYLTIHGVTQTVEMPLEAQLVGESIIVVGQLQVLLADYDISAPSAPAVAGVEDNALLELSLVFNR